MESLEDLKAIIAGKPDGKTHTLTESGVVTYWNDYDSACLAISGDSVILSGMRSLSDIERIIELMEWQIEANKNYQPMMEAYLND